MLNLNIFKITFFLTFFYGAGSTGSSCSGHRGTWRRARAACTVMAAAAAQGDNDTGALGLEEGGPWVGLGFMEGIDDV